MLQYELDLTVLLFVFVFLFMSYLQIMKKKNNNKGTQLANFPAYLHTIYINNAERQAGKL